MYLIYTDEMFLKGNLDIEILYTDNGLVLHKSLKDNQNISIINKYASEIDYEATIEVNDSV